MLLLLMRRDAPMLATHTCAISFYHCLMPLWWVNIMCFIPFLYVCTSVSLRIYSVWVATLISKHTHVSCILCCE